MKYDCPNFRQAVRMAGDTNIERARIFGVSERAIRYYLAGDRLPPVELVKRFPALDVALTVDFCPKIAS